MTFIPPFSTIPPAIDALLERLHLASRTQEDAIPVSARDEIKVAATQDPNASYALLDKLMEDKFIALDRDKALLVHQLILARGARNVVEVGTSFGVSTIYLALAVGANLQRHGGTGKVVATEKEPTKAAMAKKHWAEAGSEVEKHVEFRIGDLTETLKDDIQDVDFVLLDIWPHVALPALKLLLPRLKPGAVVLTDNVIASADRYGPLLTILRDPIGPFTSVCMPYEGGLELSVFKG